MLIAAYNDEKTGKRVIVAGLSDGNINRILYNKDPIIKRLDRQNFQIDYLCYCLEGQAKALAANFKVVCKQMGFPYEKGGEVHFQQLNLESCLAMQAGQPFKQQLNDSVILWTFSRTTEKDLANTLQPLIASIKEQSP
jgi:hypothetical protein